MPHIPQELIDIKKRVEVGEHPTVTVRELLSWFWGSKRRGSWVVTVIDEALASLELATEPHFNWASLDGHIEFMSKSEFDAAIATSLTVLNAA